MLFRDPCEQLYREVAIFADTGDAWHAVCLGSSIAMLRCAAGLLLLSAGQHDTPAPAISPYVVQYCQIPVFNLLQVT